MDVCGDFDGVQARDDVALTHSRTWLHDWGGRIRLYGHSQQGLSTRCAALIWRSPAALDAVSKLGRCWRGARATQFVYPVTDVAQQTGSSILMCLKADMSKIVELGPTGVDAAI